MERLSYDMHIHTCLSPCGDNNSTPANVVGMAALAGLDVIAICDHNTCKNLPAAMACGEAYGVIVIPGMELTTSEDVHVLCYFYTLEDALAFGEYVEQNHMRIPNKPDYFGDQLIMNEDDEEIGIIDWFLPAASNISFDDVADALKPYNGLMVPAHINKSSTSVLANLGFLPIDSNFTTCEIQTIDKIGELRDQHAYLKKCHILSSSDAHQLEDIHEAEFFLHAEERSVKAILDYLSNYLDDSIAEQA